MKLHGQAGSTELFEVFQLLSNSQKTGVLTVKRKNEVRTVQFTLGGVTLLFESTEATKRLGDILVHRGRITRKQLKKALELQQTTRRKLGELLIQIGAVKAESVNDALAYQLEEELFDLLRWEGATFDFKEGQPAAHESRTDDETTAKRKYQTTPYFDVSSILMEAARRADEWKRIHGVLTSSKTVLIRRTQDWSDRAQCDNPELVGRIWDLLDGTRNLEDLMERTAFSRFQVFEAAYQLHRAGVVQLISPEELLTQAEEKLVSGKVEYGLGLLAKACEGLEDQPELQVQAGQLYLWANRDKEAQHILDKALHTLLEKGQLEVALKFLESLHQQYPDKPYPLERLVKLYREVPNFESAERLASSLLTTYHDNHEREKAHRLLTFLSEFPLESEHSRLSLAKLLSSFGEPQLAAEQYELLGKAAQKKRHKTDAIRFYRQALHLDPSRKDAHRRLVRLTVLPRVKSRKLLRRLIAAVVILAVTAGIVAGVRNELKHRQEWKQTHGEVLELMGTRNYDEARQFCNVFLEKAVLTTTIKDARQQLMAINSAENGYLSRCRLKDRKLWTDAVKADETGSYDAKVMAYEQVIARANTESVARKAQERLDELHRRRERFETILSNATNAESKRDYAGAVRNYLDARDMEPDEWAKRKLSLPVEVTSTPKSAEVWKDGKLLGRTPLVVRHGPAEKLRLTVRCHGYLPGALKVASDNPTNASIVLRQTRLPRWTCSLGGAVDVPINVDGRRLFVSSRSGRVALLETTTGRVLWTKELGGLSGTYLSQAVRQDQSLYVAVGDGRVLKLSVDDGKELWSRNLRTLLAGTPLPQGSGDTLVAAGADGRLFGLSAKHGDVTWTLAGKEQTDRVLRVPGGFLCVGPMSIRYLCDDKSGKRKPWRRSLGERISGKPMLTGNRLYVPGNKGTLTVLNIRTGSIIAEHHLSSSALVGPAISDNRLLVADTDGTVLALNAGTGRKLWKSPLGEELNSGGTCHKMIFYIGTARGNLMAMDMRTGKVTWQTVLDGAVQTPPTIAGRLCLTATRTGTVYAISLR